MITTTIKHRLPEDQIIDAFTKLGHYSSKDRMLLEELAKFISNVVQNDNCISNKRQSDGSHGGLLKDIMCDFSYAYTPLPVAQMLEKSKIISNGKRIGSTSANGRIYSTSFNEHKAVIKTPISWSTTLIMEHYVSFRILNTLLMNNVLTEHFVASYGIFVCPSNIPNTGKMPGKNELQICYSPNSLKNKHPTLFIVQRLVNGSTFGDYLEKGQVSLSDFTHYMRQIAVALICLEECPYRISHNDLHPFNIMIEGKTASNPGNAVLIDWGLTRFQNPFTGLYYQPFTYDEYMNERDPHTGANDYFDLLKHCLFHTKKYNRELYTYIHTRFKDFSKNFINQSGTPIQDLQAYESSGDFYLFILLKNFEKHSPMKHAIHKYHLQKLGQLTYRNTFGLWCEPSDFAKIDQIVRRLREPTFFNIPKLAQPQLQHQVQPVLLANPQPVVKLKQLPAHQLALKQLFPGIGLGVAAVPVQKCKCMNSSKGIKCGNNARPGSDFCGIHKNCAREYVPLAPAQLAVAATNVVKMAAAAPSRCTCVAIIKTGVRKNQICGKPCKRGNYCGFHL
jgi:hypothetical protein